MTKYHVVLVTRTFVRGTDTASVLKLLEDSKRVPAQKSEPKTEPCIESQTDYWVSVNLFAFSRQYWAIAYLCRAGWEPFAVDAYDFYFRRTIEA